MIGVAKVERATEGARCARGFVALVAALSLAAPGVAAPEFAKMAGIGWTVISDRGVCRAETQLPGSAYANKAIAVAPLPYGEPLIIGFQLREDWSPDVTLNARVRIAGGRAEDIAMVPRQLTTDSPLYLLLSPTNATLIGAGSSMHVVFPTSESIVVDTAGLNAAMGEVKRCNSDLLSRRLAMPINLEQIAVRPTERRRLSDLFRTEDFPQDALKKGVRGDVRFLGGIDAAGRMRACVILTSSKLESLDAATCRIAMQRARYKPARDARGNSVNAPVEGKVTWLATGIIFDLRR